MAIPLFKAQTEWIPPTDFPDLSSYAEISIDLETKDPELKRMPMKEEVIWIVKKF